MSPKASNHVASYVAMTQIIVATHITEFLVKKYS